MKTIKDVFADFRQGLNLLYNANESEAITLMAVSEISNLNKAKIKAFPESELSQQQTEKLSEILDQLKTGKPIQYILGKTEFYGLPFNVNPSVLIPRPETEELVDWVLSLINSGQVSVSGGDVSTDTGFWIEGGILDIGTGSGCIAISLKKNLPDVNVFALNISRKAVLTVEKNATLNDVVIQTILSDILDLSIRSIYNQVLLSTRYSLIISNPPYVTLQDKTQMHPNVTEFEPHTALFVPEDDPLIFYKAIADFALSHLVPNGLLFFEINENYGKQIIDLLKSKHFKDIELRKDMGGRDRMVKASIV